MTVFRIDEFRKMRPNWAVLHDARIEMLSPGEVQTLHFHDHAEYLFVLEGRARIAVGGENVTVESGDVILVETGREHSVVEVMEPLVMLCMEDGPQAPFRDGPLDSGSHRKLLVHPKKPLVSPRRRAHVVTIDVEGTFAPELLRRSPGDLVLALKIGSLGETQAKEIRRQCEENKQAVAALRIDVPEYSWDTFFFDRFIKKNLDHIRPMNLAVTIDPLGPGVMKQLDILTQHWIPKTRLANMGVVLEFPLLPWNADQRASIMELLGYLPPAWWGIGVQWTGAHTVREVEENRAMLEALLPWLRILYCDPAAMDQFMHYLAGFGYQGWVAALEPDDRTPGAR